MQIIPIGKRILVVPVESEQVTASGLVIADIAKERPCKGEVIEVGEEVYGINKGDVVFYGLYSGADLKLGTEEYLVIDQADVLAVVRE